jgi:hypothetical protein
MSLLYCSLHERLFVQQRNTWATWPLEAIRLLQHLHDILTIANIECADYEVINIACDQCKEITRQILYDQFEKLNVLP